MESKLRPRLCYLVKEERDYGFHLQGGRKIGGEFIRKVVPGSSADLGGLRPGDRVVEVNGVNVEKDSHHEVVKRVRAIPNRVRLLVVDSDTDEYLRSRGLVPLAHPGSHFLLINSQYTLLLSYFPLQLQVEPSPEPTDELCPRLCHLVKEDNGYGFSLHSNKTKGGQFVHSVDPGSAAESADIRPGDRILEVNGVNIEGLTHSEVVALIKSGREEVRLLVVDQEMDELFHRLKKIYTQLFEASFLMLSSLRFLTEAYMDESATESIKSTLCSTPELPTTNPQIINVTDDRRVSDPFVDSGLVLSSTAAEAKQKVRASRNKKRAPLMEWSKKRELFSSF
uniref:PDZ domain-containing protein n=1 Tax=Monopterus albus TaxID=43700 RepID=A0A3Q3IXS9_MONAL